MPRIAVEHVQIEHIVHCSLASIHFVAQANEQWLPTTMKWKTLQRNQAFHKDCILIESACMISTTKCLLLLTQVQHQSRSLLYSPGGSRSHSLRDTYDEPFSTYSSSSPLVMLTTGTLGTFSVIAGLSAGRNTTSTLSVLCVITTYCIAAGGSASGLAAGHRYGRDN